MASLYVNHLFKELISKYSHIMRYWGKCLTYEVGGDGHTILPITLVIVWKPSVDTWWEDYESVGISSYRMCVCNGGKNPRDDSKAL